MVRMYTYVWEYHVKPEWVDRFSIAYASNGVWFDFFRQSEGYVRTELLSDASDRTRFVTIDYFLDSKARADLVEARAKMFDAIDAEWEEATISETKIGEFWMLTD